MEKRDNQEIVYLFSSAYRELYKQDVLDSLALPDGFRHHFRYEERWISEEILRNPRGIRGKTGIVVFVDRALPGEMEREPILYPIRTATILDATMVGSTIHVYFELGSYVDYPISSNREETYNQSLTETLDEGNRPFLKVSPGRKEIAGKFIGKGAPSVLALSDDTEIGQNTSWENIIRAISDSCPKVWIDTVFFRLVKIEHLLKPPTIVRFWQFSKELAGGLTTKHLPFKEAFRVAANVISEQKYEDLHVTDTFLPPQAGYMLKSGDFYAVDLYFYRVSPPSEEMQKAAVDIHLDPSFFHTSLKVPIPVAFRYDYRSFDMAVKERLSSSLTKICIGLKEEGRFMSPHLFLPTYVEAPRLKLCLFILAFLLGSVFIAISGSDLSLSGWFKITLMGLGPVLQAFGLWFIHRRLK